MRVATVALLALLVTAGTVQGAPTSTSNCVSSDRTATLLCATATAYHVGTSCDGDGNCEVRYGIQVGLGGGFGFCALDTSSGGQACSDPANPTRPVGAWTVVTYGAARGSHLTVHSRLCILDPIAHLPADCQNWVYPQTFVG